MTDYVKTQPPAEHLDGDKEIWPIVIRHIEKKVATRGSFPDGNRDHVLELLAVDMGRRNRQGIEKHGGPLTVRNGRDAAVDAYQEALDGVAYWYQEYERQDAAPAKADAYLLYDMALELAIKARRYLWERDGE